MQGLADIHKGDPGYRINEDIRHASVLPFRVMQVLIVSFCQICNTRLNCRTTYEIAQCLPTLCTGGGH